MPELFQDLYSREMGMSGFIDEMSKNARLLLAVAGADATERARARDVKRSKAIDAGSDAVPRLDYKSRTATRPGTPSRPIGELCPNEGFAGRAFLRELSPMRLTQHLRTHDPHVVLIHLKECIKDIADKRERPYSGVDA